MSSAIAAAACVSERWNMSGPIVGRAQTLGDGVQASARVICAVCDKIDKLSRCSRCKVVFYCTKEHQRRDWKRHREFCATHPAAAAVAAATAAAKEPLSSSATESFDRGGEIPSKRHPSVLLPNLSKTSVSDAPCDSSRSNVASEPCRSRSRDENHSPGMRPFIFARHVACNV